MCSGLQGHETSRYPLKCLLHPFRCRRHFLFQKDFARFIQNAVVRPAIAEVHTNRELVSFENHVSIYANSVSLFHSRSPFHCALSTSNIGSVSHPAETGLLIPSGTGLDFITMSAPATRVNCGCITTRGSGGKSQHDHYRCGLSPELSANRFCGSGDWGVRGTAIESQRW